MIYIVYMHIMYTSKGGSWGVFGVMTPQKSPESMGGDPGGDGGTCPPQILRWGDEYLFVPPRFFEKNFNFYNQGKKIVPLERIKEYSNKHFLTI